MLVDLTHSMMLPMGEEIEPSSFSNYLAEHYTDPQVNELADTIRNLAVASVIYVNPFGLMLNGYMNGARKVVRNNERFLETRDTTTRVVNDQTLTFSLVRDYPRKTFFKDYYLRREALISLVVDHKYHEPAAVILPAISEGHSASVVVGTEVNNPAHLQEIQAIVQEIYDKGWHRDEHTDEDIDD